MALLLFHWKRNQYKNTVLQIQTFYFHIVHVKLQMYLILGSSGNPSQKQMHVVCTYIICVPGETQLFPDTPPQRIISGSAHVKNATQLKIIYSSAPKVKCKKDTPLVSKWFFGDFFKLK